MGKEEKKENELFAYKHKWIILVIVTIMMCIVWYFLPNYLQSIIPDAIDKNGSNAAPAERGQYGDMYGVITSLFSGLTIAGLIFTIIQQQEALRKQAQELELTKEALINQQQEIKDNRAEIIQNREEIKLQHKTVKYQRFDNTFFNLLNLHISIADKIYEKDYTIFTNLVSSSTMTAIRENRPIVGNYASYSIESKKRFLSVIISFESIIDYIYDLKTKEKNIKKYLKLFFTQIPLEQKKVLYFHLNLRGLEPPHFDEYYELLFASIPATDIDESIRARLKGVKNPVPVKL